jgi:hypothetical protein
MLTLTPARALLELDSQRMLPIWFAAILIITPMSIIFKVAMRYYRQIIVVE